MRPRFYRERFRHERAITLVDRYSFAMSNTGRVGRAVAPATLLVQSDGERRLQAMIREHYAFVWRLLRRFGVSSAEVEDAVQDVFVVLHKRFGTLVPGGERRFLCHVAAFTARHYRRGYARRREVSLDEVPERTDDGCSSPEVAAEKEQMLRTLDEALSSLHDGDRETFVLCEIEQLLYRDAAEILSIPIGTVRSRLARARKIMLARLNQLEKSRP